MAALTKMAMAASKVRIGSLREAKMVPLVTLNWWSQPLHFQMRRAA